MMRTVDIMLIPPPPLNIFADKKGGGGTNVISRYLVFSLKTGFWPNAKIG